MHSFISLSPFYKPKKKKKKKRKFSLVEVIFNLFIFILPNERLI